MNLSFTLEQFAVVLIIIIVYITQGVNSLEVSSLIVPEQVILGKAALLNCKYSLQGDQLYSLTWFKDGHEFLKIRPGYPTYIYPTKGVYTKIEDPSGSLLLLWKTDIHSEGEYSCEVTGEAPRFITSIKHASLSVVALPKTGPRIKGGKSQYSTGDKLNLTCISGPSYPPANLTWYINGHRANGITEEIINTNAGLKLSKAKLSLEVEPKHLISGELKLRCLATISNIYWNSSEQPPQTTLHQESHNEVTPSFLSHSSQSMSSTGDGLSYFYFLLIVTAIYLY